MPLKSRKSLTSSWYSCEACGVFISHKDVQGHRGLCPVDLISYKHPFIKNSSLFSFVEKYSITDVVDAKSFHGDSSFVYLSQSAMQICQFEIGEQVVLRVNNRCLDIRTVWPTTERTLTSVILSPNDLALSNSDFKEGTRIKVQKIKIKPVPASLVQLKGDDVLRTNNEEHFLTVCKTLYLNKVLVSGSHVTVPFYGKTFVLRITEILPVDMVPDGSKDFLTEQLKILNINESLTEDICFVALETTKWSLIKTVCKNCDTSKVTEANSKVIGGYKEVIKELSTTMSLVLKRTQSTTSNLQRSVGILLFGPNGVGKTFISQSIANDMNLPVIKINVDKREMRLKLLQSVTGPFFCKEITTTVLRMYESGELFSKFYGETELRLKNLFTAARNQSPSIIFLDNVDTLCPKKAASEQERRVVAYLLTLLDSIKNNNIVVLATTSQITLIDSSLRRPGRLDCEMELPVPSVDDRHDILKVLLSKERIEESYIMSIAKAAHGFVAADLQCLVAKAMMQATSENRVGIEISDLIWALSLVKPSAMREMLIQVPNVKWDDIGGMDSLKLKLQQAIEWPLLHPDSFSRLGINPPRGVLMYGPPGCSKTMIAKALASESNLNFLSIKGSELFSKWVGESEKAVQTLFKKARSVAPSIVFIDELDAIGGERSGTTEGSNVQERVLAQLLTEIDGVESLGNVNIVAATNRPDRIDKALLRPGRLDRMVYVPLPDLPTRISILQLQLNKMPAKNTNINYLALQTEGYSGAEVVAVCHEAAINALQEDLNATEILERHFLSALDMVKPRTPSSLLALYKDYL